jgi:hypothetical protein
VSRPAGERREEKGRNHRACTARDCRHQACICRGGRRGRRPPPHEHAAVWEAAAAEHGEWKRRWSTPSHAREKFCTKSFHGPCFGLGGVPLDENRAILWPSEFGQMQGKRDGV